MAIVSLPAQSRHYSGTIFGPRRKRKRKQRKGLLFSVDFGLDRIRRPAGPEKAPLSDPKILGLEGAGRALGSGGARGGHRWGTPGLSHALGPH